MFALLLLHLLFIPVFSITCRQNPTIHHFQFNTSHGIILSDGPIFINPESFSVPTSAVHRSYKALFRTTNPIILHQNILLLDTPAGRLLVDTGALGEQSLPLSQAAGKLLQNFQAANINPASIDAVLLTHGHIDHVAGLTKPDGSKTFENAHVYVGRREHLFWTNPTNDSELALEALSNLSEIYKRSITPYIDRLFLVDENTTALPGVRFLPTPGHTPGHNAIEITVGDQRLVVTGDSWISQPDQLRNPEWGYEFESNREQAYESRIELLELVAQRGDLVLSYHESFPGLGHVVQNGHLFDWVPASQLNGFGVALKC